MAFVPEGQADRSQARSAWENATPEKTASGKGSSLYKTQMPGKNGYLVAAVHVDHTGLRPKGRPNTVGHASKPRGRLC